MIIEVYGLPSSGKSRFAARLQELLVCEGNRVRPLRIYDGILGVLRFPLIFFTLCSVGMRHAQGGARWYILKHFVLSRLAELGRAWRRQRNTCQILDEGPLQALLSVSEELHANNVRRILLRSPAKYIAVFGGVNDEQHARTLARVQKLRPYLSNKEREAWCERLIEGYVRTLSVLEKDGRVRVIETVEDIQYVLHELEAEANKAA